MNKRRRWKAKQRRKFKTEAMRILRADKWARLPNDLDNVAEFLRRFTVSANDVAAQFIQLSHLVAQRTAQRSPTPRVAGSNPAEVTTCSATSR